MSGFDCFSFFVPKVINCYQDILKGALLPLHSNCGIIAPINFTTVQKPRNRNISFKMSCGFFVTVLLMLFTLDSVTYTLNTTQPVHPPLNESSSLHSPFSSTPMCLAFEEPDEDNTLCKKGDDNRYILLVYRSMGQNNLNYLHRFAPEVFLPPKS